jgi:Flp pilus assembly protein TadG
MRLVRRSHDATLGERAPAQRGQSLVEFSLVMMPLFIIILGIIQFGFIFNAYVTITNAAREGGRTGTVYIYDPSKDKDQNDAARCEKARQAFVGSMNLLNKTAPNFTNSAVAWTRSGLVYTNGDLTCTYSNPAAVIETDARVGQQITVRGLYHMDLIIPLIAQLLPRDAGGRLGLTSEVTMVLN